MHLSLTHFWKELSPVQVARNENRTNMYKQNVCTVHHWSKQVHWSNPVNQVLHMPCLSANPYLT